MARGTRCGPVRADVCHVAVQSAARAQALRVELSHEVAVARQRRLLRVVDGVVVAALRVAIPELLRGLHEGRRVVLRDDVGGALARDRRVERHRTRAHHVEVRHGRVAERRREVVVHQRVVVGRSPQARRAIVAQVVVAHGQRALVVAVRHEAVHGASVDLQLLLEERVRRVAQRGVEAHRRAVHHQTAGGQLDGRVGEAAREAITRVQGQRGVGRAVQVLLHGVLPVGLHGEDVVGTRVRAQEVVEAGGAQLEDDEVVDLAESLRLLRGGADGGGVVRGGEGGTIGGGDGGGVGVVAGGAHGGASDAIGLREDGQTQLQEGEGQQDQGESGERRHGGGGAEGERMDPEGRRAQRVSRRWEEER